jgi:hypothetical protein
MSVDCCVVTGAFFIAVLSEAFAAEPPSSATAPTVNTIANFFIEHSIAYLERKSAARGLRSEVRH